jgi:riboflavin synthase
MFTGIIEGQGFLARIQPGGEGSRLEIDAGFSIEHTRLGDSIAVNGACLTVVRLNGRRCQVDVSPETLDKTTLGAASVGQRLNLERALRVGDRLDGHLVSGHVDGTGILAARTVRSNAIILTFKVAPDLARYMIAKGSVAVDGVSLTINRCDKDSFEVSIIPHTADITTIGTYRVGDAMNIETDMIGKYIEKFVARARGKSVPTETGTSGLDLNFLHKTGFL